MPNRENSIRGGGRGGWEGVRDRSLINGRGGDTKREGGGGRKLSFTPTKRGSVKGFSHAEGGHK